MKVYNTAVPVIANVMADDPEDAVRRLSVALRHAGFEPDDEAVKDAVSVAFEAEPGTVADL